MGKPNIKMLNTGNSPGLPPTQKSVTLKSTKPDGLGSIYREKVPGQGKDDPDNLYLWMQGNFDSGIISGSDCCIYFPNGNPQYRGQMRNGKKEGTGTAYHFDGSISFKGQFRNDLPFGKNTCAYNVNGKLEYRGGQSNGHYFGFGYVSYNNGQVKYIGEFQRHMPKDGEVRIL